MATGWWALLWIFGAVILVALGKWIAWSVTQRVEQIVEPIEQKVDLLTGELRSHMAEEKVTSALNVEQHEEFRRRIDRLEDRVIRP